AQWLWEAGRQPEAVDHYREMLRLNPGDNQGVRYVLLACLLETGDGAGAQELLDHYPEDIAAAWAYGRALAAFQTQGDTRSSRALLAKARKANPYLPAYLVGTKQLPQHLPDYIGIGDEPEAIACASEQMEAWQNTPDALAWLERSLDDSRARGRAAAGSARESVPRDLRPHFDALVGLTDAVCREHLNEEYAQLCRRLAAALCRKRPSPVTRGRLESWACGITYTIGSVNFLFDKSQEPHLTAGELCALFGVSPSTGAAKATEIRKLFRMRPYDPEWCLPSKLDQNPFAWMIMVNGIIMDARHAPREVQEEALRLGLIPRLPGSGPG
ncbi:MAG: tetratricopeptide repeat protein, partial [Chloroflexi bacterium]|nr:tetratricopeptide repeat protein [Chloroflexota bacterium]